MVTHTGLGWSLCFAGSCGSALRRHMEMVIEARKLDVEGAHQWKQIKHLLKYIKCQEKEISKTERYVVCNTLMLSCELQHVYVGTCLRTTTTTKNSSKFKKDL